MVTFAVYWEDSEFQALKAGRISGAMYQRSEETNDTKI